MRVLQIEKWPVDEHDERTGCESIGMVNGQNGREWIHGEQNMVFFLKRLPVLLAGCSISRTCLRKSGQHAVCVELKNWATSVSFFFCMFWFPFKTEDEQAEQEQQKRKKKSGKRFYIQTTQQTKEGVKARQRHNVRTDGKSGTWRIPRCCAHTRARKEGMQASRRRARPG
jgi:hypothetical protein